ncbi:hypothetical protein AHY58_005163 [Salmonella enterica subsp. enterica]|uniref:Uncharacterized protein n=1 Tax=Salmonella enterica TaxID=28901 RepID=A0A379SHM4_SALER|nr:hypothetical protein [Salmonella enterica subsp. enterica serovar Mikawasima]SUG27562.1 Uncharacterised protein [Salmonella enterica]SUJ09303.1 Uncharacterised protein [Salmonella enterica subsp. salamae]SUG27598.1 Uncharacterised protein [Salmonella enterica]SUG27611.1 Uncharacterised protein [Salmonella enterica]
MRVVRPSCRNNRHVVWLRAGTDSDTRRAGQVIMGPPAIQWYQARKVPEATRRPVMKARISAQHPVLNDGRACGGRARRTYWQVCFLPGVMPSSRDRPQG